MTSTGIPLSATSALQAIPNVNGWTVFLASPDTRKVHVSSSLGDDATAADDDPAKPYKTLVAACARLREGKPDWLLLKRGDTWTDEAFSITVGGRSAVEPMLVSAYGAGPRPLVKSPWPGAAMKLIGGGSAGNFMAVAGLELYCHRRDPQNPLFAGPGTATNFAGIAHLNPCQWFLVEDCDFSFYQSNANFQLAPKGQVIVRRSFFSDAYSVPSVGHSQGLFLHNVSEPVIEDCVFDHNGWNESVPEAVATIFNHNAYIQKNCGPVVARRNIFANASSHGMQARSGGVVEDNLFVRNPIALLLGGEAPQVPHLIRARRNVVLESSDISPGTGARGWGIDVNGTLGSEQAVAGNIIAHSAGTQANGHGICLYPTTNGVQAADNIIFDWKIGIKNQGQNNIVTPNSIDLDGDNAEFSFPDPHRTIAGYDALHGGPGTLANFLTETRRQRFDHWRLEYTALAVNFWIRAGFVT